MAKFKLLTDLQDSYNESNDFLTCRLTQLLPEIAGERLSEKGNYLILFSTTKTLVTDFVYNG